MNLFGMRLTLTMTIKMGWVWHPSL